MQRLQTLDYLVFLFYFIVVATYGYWIYNRKKKAETDSKDFFLAEGSLTWWAIGASLIASNISAEQMIGMSGSGFKMGLAISTYEWMAAATLMIVAIFFMPIYLKNKIYTMPQFLTQRYSSTVSTIMAVFWLLLYVIVNLTSILYLGSLARGDETRTAPSSRGTGRSTQSGRNCGGIIIRNRLALENVGQEGFISALASSTRCEERSRR